MTIDIINAIPVTNKMIDAPHQFISTHAHVKGGVGVAGRFYNGVSAIPHAAYLQVTDTQVQIITLQAITSQSFEYAEPIKSVDFGYATQHGVRLVSFANGAQFQADNTVDLNHYLLNHKIHHSWIDTLTSKWRWVLLCAIAIAVVIAALYQWGTPLGARLAAPIIPKKIKSLLGDTALESLDEYAFEPSKLDAHTQTSIQTHWEKALGLAYPKKDYPEHKILFRKMLLNGKNIPNAMTLPNGTIVVTDALANILTDKPDAITGVLAHELGHLEHHHSMRALLEFSSLGAISALLLGDYTVWINQLPLFMGQMKYSRDHEIEADDAAIKLMRAAHIQPAELAVFFDRVTAQNTQNAQEALAKKNSHDKQLACTTTDTAKTTTKTTDKITAKNSNTDSDTGHCDAGDNEGYAADWLKNVSIPDMLQSHPSSEERMKKLRNANL